MTIPRPIIIDTDPGLSVHLSADIDDDLALLFLLASPEVEIAGITCTYGNSSIGRTFADAQALLAHAGRSDLPVLKGAGWMSRDVNRETDASRFLAETILKRPGEITVLTLGPLTNLATALTFHPELAEAIPELVMMGGRLPSGRSEFNFSAHPRATNLALRAPLSKFLVTLDLCFQVAFSQAELDRLESKPNSAISRYLPVIRRWLKLQRFLIRLARLRYPELTPGGFFPWDGIAAAYLLEPSLFSAIKPLDMWMEKNRMLNREDLSGLDPRFAVRAPFQVDSRRFLGLFVERLGSLR